MDMRKNIQILVLPLVLLLAGACQKDNIRTFAMEDSAVNFKARSSSFSMKGITEPTAEFSIPVEVVGIPADYDREIALEVKDSTAVLGRDFTIVSAVIPAEALLGNIVIRVNQLTEEVPDRACTMLIKPNDFFRAGMPNYQKCIVSWTELYSRPAVYTWRYWFLYLCPAYSQNLHKLLVEEFGLDVEKYTLSTGYLKEDPTLIFKSPTWWWSANRQLREVVAEHDAANPDAPYRHSNDYETYKTWTVPVGEGVRPGGTPPTILETLAIL